MGIGDWGLGIGDWGLGIGPNPQSPIPNPQSPFNHKKIDNLESKISRTLVDTLIDLQMDEQPLIVKRNLKDISEQKCASCGQNLPNINNNRNLNTSVDYKGNKIKNKGEKDKLPDIKQSFPK